jgi:hypothetical protein
VTDTPEITAARGEASAAQARFCATLHELQQRVAPKTLAREAWDGAKSKGADLAEDAVDAVKRRPVAAGGVVAALALFLAREPLKDLAGRIVPAKKHPAKKPRRTQRTPKTQVKVESEE